MTKTKSIIYCGLFTALIAVGAFIKIPIPVVPFTLQYLFTMLAGNRLCNPWTGRTSHLQRRRRSVVYLQTKFWLSDRILCRNFFNRISG